MGKLIVEDIACQRGGRNVLERISFELEFGSTLQLTGPNGSGKSTLLRLIAGLGELTAGRLRLEGGHDSLSIGQQCHLIAHQDAVKPALTVSENLRFWRDFLGGGDLDRALSAFALERLADDAAALLSAGQKKRLSLSRLALIPRRLWLLDEPSVGLDRASLGRLDALIAAHLASGGMAIVATHVPLGIAAQRNLDLGQAA